jgi:hypothetical protein
MRITRFKLCKIKRLKFFQSMDSQHSELEAKVVQIQSFVQLSLCYLISVDQQDLVL